MTSRETGHEPEAREVPPPRRWQLTVGAFTLGALVVLVDQGTKTWAEATLTEGERVPLIGNLLGLQLAYNPGAAFSFGCDFRRYVAGFLRCSVTASATSGEGR